jgi:hypothetical protein
VLLTVSPAQTLQVTLAGSYTVMATNSEGCNAASISNTIVITTGAISTPIITGYLKVCEGGKTRLLVSPTDASMAYELFRWTQVKIEPPGFDSIRKWEKFFGFCRAV